MATISYAVILSTLMMLIEAQYNNQQSSYDHQQYQPQQQQQQYQPQQQQQQYQSQQQYQPNQPQHHAILMHKQALGQDGTFNYAFKSDNGLQQGESISPDGSRVGGYSYVDPDGKTISVKYSAGKDGFKILEGDHIPKAPLPIPAPAAQPAYQPNQYQQSQPLKQYQPSQNFGQLYHKTATKNYNTPAGEDDGSYRPEGDSGFKDLGSPYREQLSGFGNGAQYSGKPLYRVQENHGDSHGNLFVPKSATYPSAPKPAQYNKPTFTPSPKYSQKYSNGQQTENDGDNGDYSQEKEHSGPHNFGSGYSFEFGG